MKTYFLTCYVHFTNQPTFPSKQIFDRTAHLITLYAQACIVVHHETISCSAYIGEEFQYIFVVNFFILLAQLNGQEL